MCLEKGRGEVNVPWFSLGAKNTGDSYYLHIFLEFLCFVTDMLNYAPNTQVL